MKKIILKLIVGIPLWNKDFQKNSSLLIDFLNKWYLGTNNGGANKSKNGGDKLIILPITQLQLLLSMGIAEVLLLSDPNYTFSIGSENYFSLAVGAFVAGIVIFAIIAIKIGSTIKFKDYQKEKLLVKAAQT